MVMPGKMPGIYSKRGINMEKSYVEYMKEISSQELFEGLLAYGMFADKLPPVFTSESFFSYCVNYSPVFESKSTDYIRFNSMRNTNVPRQLGIPTPMNYYRLCKELEQDWNDIKDVFIKNTSNDSYKVSRIHLRKRFDSTSLFEMNYNDWKNDGNPTDDMLIGNRYIVQADISTCFPSIYSHSIPWAVAGKEFAKAHKSNEFWWNRVDLCCRNIKSQETLGLLIGPHASNLVSELVLSSIDKELVAKGWRYIRNIDDYTCYVESLELAQQFLVDLNNQLNKYNLLLNHKKTQIEELPMAMTKHWVRKLNAFRFDSANDLVKYKDVKAYFDLAIELMNEVGDAAILKYAIKVLSKKELTFNAKEYFIKECLHIAIIYPYLLSVVEHTVFDKFDITKDLICNFSNAIFNDGIKYANYEACCYAMYYALKYEFTLKDILAEDIIELDDCLIKLFGYYYFKCNDDSKLDLFINDAKNLNNQEFDRNWLFVYEVLDEKELKGDWKKIKKKKVSFVKGI